MHDAVVTQSDYGAFERIEGQREKGLLLLCDHASNYLPPKYGTLGLDGAQFERHIAYDIGAQALTRGLASRLGVPAVMSKFSRLLIDPNRGIDDPTIIMQLSDGTIIPGNYPLEASEREFRIMNFHQPYHDAINTEIGQFFAEDIVPVVFSVHSFTHAWKGVARPWHVTILWDSDARFPIAMLDALKRQDNIIVGDNEPYDGALGNDTMFTHCTRRGLAHALVEVRQDLICDRDGVDEWVERLVPALEETIKMPQMHEVKYGPSRTGPVDHIKNDFSQED